MGCIGRMGCDKPPPYCVDGGCITPFEPFDGDSCWVKLRL